MLRAFKEPRFRGHSQAEQTEIGCKDSNKYQSAKQESHFFYSKMRFSCYLYI